MDNNFPLRAAPKDPISALVSGWIAKFTCKMRFLRARSRPWLAASWRGDRSAQDPVDQAHVSVHNGLSSFRNTVLMLLYNNYKAE